MTGMQNGSVNVTVAEKLWYMASHYERVTHAAVVVWKEEDQKNMESDRRYLVKNHAVYVDGSWYMGEDAEFGPQSDYSIYLGEGSFLAARKLRQILTMKKDNT